MSKPGDYEAVKKDIKSVIPQPGYDDGSAGPVFVRLAWHASGNYSLVEHTGGSNGAGMRFPPESVDPANAGLFHAINFLNPVQAKHSWISHSDLWTLAGVTAVETMGGPKIPWTPGRTDYSDEQAASSHRGEVGNRLPDGAKGADHIREIFGRMGFTDREIVALSGAHNLGRCHSDRSGFEGPWVTNPTRFSNQYFKLLLSKKWAPKKWDGPFQFETKLLGQELMMLPTDMALIEDKAFREFVEIYAEDKDVFFEDFAKAFGKLLELGVDRSEDGLAHLIKKAEKEGVPVEQLAPKEAFEDGHKPMKMDGVGCPYRKGKL
ncbi:cytochrome-c peroxidase [Phaffia rhodozyma]|uniref:Peroxidase n=1 Tax=Phaffia rhodozyma TaxID=264483 RepID=A0A0F7SY75_PHARH|nr:cytochrome-c peroxidase [Phaffia rhodozyma]